jgi:formylglycine-generating enzyme required for sulfatase activity
VRAVQTQTGEWQRQLALRLDHPVVNVNWRDAGGYAAWLARLTGQPWRLPSEAEWVKAARRTDRRIYLWGDTFDSSRANTREARLIGQSCYPPRLGLSSYRHA